MIFLHTDQEFFEARFPDALAYTVAANLRKEFFMLAMANEPTVWQKARLREFVNNPPPAIKEPWFLELLERNRKEDLVEQIESAE